MTPRKTPTAQQSLAPQSRASMRPRHDAAENVDDRRATVDEWGASMRPRHDAAENDEWGEVETGELMLQ